MHPTSLTSAVKLDLIGLIKIDTTTETIRVDIVSKYLAEYELQTEVNVVKQVLIELKLDQSHPFKNLDAIAQTMLEDIEPKIISILSSKIERKKFITLMN